MKSPLELNYSKFYYEKALLWEGFTMGLFSETIGEICRQKWCIQDFSWLGASIQNSRTLQITLFFISSFTKKRSKLGVKFDGSKI